MNGKRNDPTLAPRLARQCWSLLLHAFAYRVRQRVCWGAAGETGGRPQAR